MEPSQNNPASEPLEPPSSKRKGMSVTIVLSNEVREETEAALLALETDTKVCMPVKGWVERVYVRAWKVEMEKFRKKNSLDSKG